MAAALKLFVAFGFHGTPTSRIAKEAGVANGTLFHYFKTKDDLIIALYIDIKIRMSSQLSGSSEGDGSTKAKLKSLFLGMMQWALDNPNEFHFIQQFHTSPFFSRITPDEILEQSQYHLKLIEEGISTGIIREMPVELIHTLVMSHVFGFYQYLNTVSPAEPERKKIMEESFDTLWRMLS